MANHFDQYDAPTGDITARREADRAHIYADELSVAPPEQKTIIENEMRSNGIPGAAPPKSNYFDKYDAPAPKAAVAPPQVPAAPGQIPPAPRPFVQPAPSMVRAGYADASAPSRVPQYREGERTLSSLITGSNKQELNPMQTRMVPRYIPPNKSTLPDATQFPYELGGVATDVASKFLPPGGAAAVGTGVNLATSFIPAPPAGAAARGVARGAESMIRPGAEGMRGVGAAETAADTLRRQRAADLPVPIPLTKGQAGRDFGQQQFEREAAKSPKVGEPLRERFSDQNKKMLLNFDAWVDQTGAAAPNARGAGTAVVGAIEKKAQAAKAEIRAAYDEAEKKGELAARVNTKPLVEYIEKNRPEAINAPVLASVEQKLIQLGGATRGADGKLVAGEVPINDLEELRKMINRVSDSTPTNGRFGTEVKKVIDQATEGAGGNVYARARRLRTRYAQEFEEQGVIDKLVRTKPGTKDRAVAYEDVFDHAVLNGSLDDMRAVRKVLQTQGDQGKQAWRELQGQAVMHLKEVATKGVSMDQHGNPIISPAALNKTVQALDKDGKLDYLFGKKGAQQIRDINDLAKDVYTAPPGSVNSSNTASVLLAALDSTFSAVSGLPAPMATALKLLKENLAGRKVKKRVRESLAQPAGQIPPPP